MYLVKEEVRNKRYEKIGTLVEEAQSNDEDAIEELLKMFESLINKLSYMIGLINEDLRGELLIRFTICLKNFTLDREYFLQQYNQYRGDENI